MRYGISIAGDRIAPRCSYAESILVVVLNRNQTKKENTAALSSGSLLDLVEVLTKNRVDTLICGGITRAEREFLSARDVDIVDNVACSIDEILKAIQSGELRSGLGFAHRSVERTPGQYRVPVNPDVPENRILQPRLQAADSDTFTTPINCLTCNDRVCLQGRKCEYITPGVTIPVNDIEAIHMLEAALDIESEKERTLCRLSELIYFCLEMRYTHLGIPYCVDLEEPTRILTRVLRRFFDVSPVCCKAGGIVHSDPYISDQMIVHSDHHMNVSCNPKVQAQLLNRLETDLNVLVGLCVGVDAVFTRNSEAPVTTLFVKDKSLANNPIGALYSDYYLKEASLTSADDH